MKYLYFGLCRAKYCHFDICKPKYKHVDLVFGTHNIHELQELILKLAETLNEEAKNV